MQSVVKAFAVIGALLEKGEARAAELAELVGEPRSSVYRMLTTLQQLEVVEAGDRRGVFRPGLGLVRLGGAVLTRFDERRVVMPTLEKLRAQTKETVHLSLRRGFQAVFIERLHGERMHSFAIDLGGVLPLHVGAAPRALLAFEPDWFWDEYFASVTVGPWTPSAPKTEAEIRELLFETRRTGVSVSDEDVVVGVTTVGAPIFDHRGRVRAALAFNLLPEVFRRDPEIHLKVARDAADDASRAFGYDPRENGLPTVP
jgi:DNA-binding IclR family transcriptional regulator